MTTTKIKVQKNIPITKKLGGQPAKYPFGSMEVGDCFDAGTYERKRMQSIYGSVYFYMGKKENKKKKFSCRKTADNRMKVWRVK